MLGSVRFITEMQMKSKMHFFPLTFFYLPVGQRFKKVMKPRRTWENQRSQTLARGGLLLPPQQASQVREVRTLRAGTLPVGPYLGHVYREGTCTGSTRVRAFSTHS